MSRGSKKLSNTAKFSACAWNAPLSVVPLKLIKNLVQAKEKKENIGFCGTHKKHAKEFLYLRAMTVGVYGDDAKDIEETMEEVAHYYEDDASRPHLMSHLDPVITMCLEFLETERHELTAIKTDLEKKCEHNRRIQINQGISASQIVCPTQGIEDQGRAIPRRANNERPKLLEVAGEISLDCQSL